MVTTAHAIRRSFVIREREEKARGTGYIMITLPAEVSL